MNTTLATCYLPESGAVGTWIHIPTCIVVVVELRGSLAVPKGSVLSLTDFDLIGSQATVLCDAGYVLSTDTLSTCSLPHSVVCPGLSLGVSISSIIYSHPPPHPVGCTATIQCAPGFALAPKASVFATCEQTSVDHDALWTNVPICDGLNQGAPTKPAEPISSPTPTTTSDFFLSIESLVIIVSASVVVASLGIIFFCIKKREEPKPQAVKRVHSGPSPVSLSVFSPLQTAAKKILNMATPKRAKFRDLAKN